MKREQTTLKEGLRKAYSRIHKLENEVALKPTQRSAVTSWHTNLPISTTNTPVIGQNRKERESDRDGDKPNHNRKSAAPNTAAKAKFVALGSIESAEIGPTEGTNSETQINPESSKLAVRPEIRSNGQLAQETSTEERREEECTTKVNWGDIVRNGSTATQDMPHAQTAQVKKAKDTLQANSTHAEPRPTAVAVYFRNVRRGLISSLRQALRQCQPSWALLGINFIGASILEVVSDERLQDRLIGTLGMMAVKHIPHFDIYDSSVTKYKCSAQQSGKDTTVQSW